MSGSRGARKKEASDVEVLSWRQKKAIGDAEEEAVRREVEEIISWTAMIEKMDDSQLKEYVSKRPQSLQSADIGKSEPAKKVRSKKPRASSSSSSSLGLMATIWKYHKEEEGEASLACSV